MSDLISRAEAIEAIESRHTEQWIESDIDYNSGLESALCEIKALPSAEASQNLAEPNKELKGSDLIRREDAMGAVQDHFNADGFKGYDDGQKMMDRITALPSAEPKTGKWVDCRRGCNYYANCSNCGMQIDVKEQGGYPNFCPNCGARMKGADDEREDIQSTDE